MMPRYVYVNYDISHMCAETIFRGLMIKLRCKPCLSRCEGPIRANKGEM